MSDVRPAIVSFAEALEGVKELSPQKRKKWITYAGAMPDEFVDFLTGIAKENPPDMLLLEKSLEEKKIALSADDVGAWSRILKGERSLLGTI